MTVQGEIRSSATARQEVYAAFADRSADLEEATRRALEVGREWLALEMGFLTRIEDGVQTILLSVGEERTLEGGTSCPLDRAYCKRTIEIDGPLSVQNVPESREISDAAYETFDQDTYIGTTVHLGDEVYGTVCFSSPDSRAEIFSEDEELFVELLAQLIGQALERREYRQRLERESQRYQTLVEANFDVIYQVDQDGTFEFVSPGVEEMLGYDLEAIQGEHFETIVRDSSRRAARTILETTFDGEAIEGVELSVERADGTVAILEINATPIVEEGTVVLAQGVARDITARKHRERQLRRFENAVEHAGHVVMITDADGEIEYVNPAFEETTGYGREEVIGETPAILNSETHDTEFYEDLWETIQRGEIWQGRVVNERANGDRYVINQTISPITDAENELDGYVAINQEITERLEREAELQLKNRAINEAHIGITIQEVTDNGRPFSFVNDHFTSLTGYDPEALNGRGLEAFAGEATDVESIRTLEAGMDAGESTAVEWVTYREDGTPFWNATSLTPVRGPDGTVTHIVGFHTDVTQRQRTARLLDVLNRVLRHNIRNDLTAILGYASLLEDDGMDVSAVARDITATGEDLLEVSERARELEQFTDREHVPVSYDPDQLLSTVAQQFRETVPEMIIDVSVDTDDWLVSGPEMERVLSELLENAVVHDDDPPTSVQLTVRRSNEHLELTVIDDGPGIHPDEASIIEMGRETALDHNLGLGLWIVNWIVTKYGGSFQIQQTADSNTGTSAVLRLPVVGSEETLEATSVKPTPLFW